MKQVAVIILNWNGAALLRRYLPTVISGTDAAVADIIVADNGSTDNSLQVLREEFPEVKVLAFEKNYGFAEGYNLAIGQTMYPYTVLLNSDVRTPQGWLNPLLDYMEAHPEVGAVMPKLLHDREDGREMSMPVPLAGISTVTAIPIAGGASLSTSRMITASMMTAPRASFGLRAPV